MRESISPKVGAMIADLKMLRDTIAEGVPLEQRFTVSMISVMPPREYGPEDIKRVRNLLNASQAVFAGFLGVTLGTVCAWEQGRRRATGPVLRLLEDIEFDSKRWAKRFRSMARIRKSSPK